MLTARHIRRQHDADHGPAVVAGLDVELPAERARALLDGVVARPPPLAGAVVGDLRLDAAVPALGHPDRDPRRRAAPERLVPRLPNDLVETDAGVLREALGRLHV